MSGETESNVSGWTTDTLHSLLVTRLEELHRLLAEKDTRYQQRYEAQQLGIRDALAAAERANTKAETATEKRFDGVNEFRDQLRDQAATFMPRTETETIVRGLLEKIAAAEVRVTQHDVAFSTLGGRSAGLGDAWGYVVGAVGLAGAVIAIVLSFAR